MASSSAIPSFATPAGDLAACKSHACGMLRSIHSSACLAQPPGASTYLKGWGGASQKVMLEGYKRHGIEFDRILLWEAGKVDPAQLYGELPPELFHSYQVRGVAEQRPGW